MPDTGASSNPLSSRHEEYSGQTLLLYKVTHAVTYLLLVVTVFYYAFNAPHEGHQPWHTIWGQNVATSFAQNMIITSIYWIVIFLHQLWYIANLVSSGNVWVAPDAGAHYVVNNLLLFGFVHLWVRAHFWLAELLLIINFFNLSTTYFRNSSSHPLIHLGLITGPLAWNFVGLYWVGARCVDSNGLAARIVGNIFIWGYLAYGSFFLVAFKDYYMGMAMSILSFSTGVAQFLSKIPILQLQWIFAFAIGGLLFLFSVAVASGRYGPFKRGEIVSEDRERAPLLADE